MESTALAFDPATATQYSDWQRSRIRADSRSSGCSSRPVRKASRAGALALRLGLPAPTLSFHLKELAQAGLARARPQGRFVIYSADFAAINGLIGYLTENCCGGSGRLVAAADCASVCAPDACTPSPTRTRRS